MAHTSGDCATDTAPALQTAPEAVSTPSRSGSKSRWLKRLGVAGFLFFLVKGLLWLLIPAAYFAYRAIIKA